ncbi:hypothetical protein MHUMG1_08734 [Metarhizium humberi]|uniref:Uncharacterized protein n=1 Tax=Metarhizium humberi TaxID=2596975 RepID=A0A9P8S3K7_9HYPO|nr:hypothetical protein MHUMG1_08734 [Metarhizium humberi]
MLVSCTQTCGIFNSRGSDSATAVHKVFGLVRQPTRETLQLGQNFTPYVLFVQTPSFVLYSVLTASIVHLANTISFTHTISVAAERKGPMPAKRAGFSALRGLEEDVTSLEEMEQCHPFAKKVLSILCYPMKAWNVHVEVEAGEISLQDCIELCRPYDRPESSV